MADTLSATILNNTYTKKDLQRRLRLLRQYLESKEYKKGSKMTLSTFLKTKETSEDDLQAMKSWGSSFWKKFNKKNLYSLLKKLKEEFEEVDVITVFSPIELDAAAREKMGNWFKKNISDNILIDLRYDPTLSIGCALVHHGRWGDFSLGYFLRDKRNDIMKIIEAYDV